MATVARASDYGREEEKDLADLPRFHLPNDSEDAFGDPLDAASTVERPALTVTNLVRGRRPSVRRVPIVTPAPVDMGDSGESEVAPEDILQETYVSPSLKARRASGSIEAPRSVPPRSSLSAHREPSVVVPEPPITERLLMASGPSNAYYVGEHLMTPAPASSADRRASFNATQRSAGVAIAPAPIPAPVPPPARTPRSSPPASALFTPPNPNPGASVDALLAAPLPPPPLPPSGTTRAAPPRMAPHAPPHAGYVPQKAFETTPSLAPVVYGSHPAPLHSGAVDYHRVQPTVLVRAQTGKSGNGPIWSLALLAVGILVGIGVALALPPGTLSRAAKPAPSPTVIVMTPAASAVPAPQPPIVSASALPQAPPVAPVSPSALADAPPPKPVIEPNMTLVTFPASAVGHRVYVDNGLITHSPAQAKVKCGKRKIRIGKESKARTVECPCGGEIVLE